MKKLVMSTFFLLLSLSSYGQEGYKYVDPKRKFSIVFPYKYKVIQDTYINQNTNVLIIRFYIEENPINIMIIESAFNKTFKDSMTKIFEIAKRDENKGEIRIIEFKDFFLNDGATMGKKFVSHYNNSIKETNNSYLYYFSSLFENKFLSFQITSYDGVKYDNAEYLEEHILELEMFLKTFEHYQ